jgi:hypothetical protein
MEKSDKTQKSPRLKGKRMMAQGIFDLKRPPGFLQKTNNSWTPWLVIRDHIADKGETPSPIIFPFCFFSPDVWIESSTGKFETKEKNYVNALIHNSGLADAYPVKVEFWYFLNGMDDWKLIGTEWVKVPALSIKHVRCRTPVVLFPIPEGFYWNQRVIVQCSEPVFDPIQFPFDPIFDRHVSGFAGIFYTIFKKNTKLKIPVKVSNPFPLHAKISVTLNIEHFAFKKKGMAKKVKPRQLRSLIQKILIDEHKEKKVNKIGNTGLKKDNSFINQKSSVDCPTCLKRGESHYKLNHLLKQNFRFKFKTDLSDKKIFIEPSADPRAFSTLAKKVENLNNNINEYKNDQQSILLTDVLLQPYEQRILDLEIEIPASIKSDATVFIFQHYADGMVIDNYCSMVTLTNSKKIKEENETKT